MSDLNEKFTPNVSTFKYNYRINLIYYNMEFQISANCEQEALDYVVDYYAKEHPDMILSLDQEDELRAQGKLKEYLSGGVEGRYLASKDVTVKETKNEGVAAYENPTKSK